MPHVDPLVEVVSLLHDFEERHGAWELAAAGTPYWQSVRVAACDAVARARGLGAERQQRRRYQYVRPFLSRPRYAARTLARYHLPRQPVDVLVLPHSRYQEMDGTWMCPYSGPLLSGLDRSFVSLARSNKGFHFHPDSTPHAHYLDGVYALANAEFVLREGLRGLALTRGERAEVTDWVTALGRHAGVRLDATAMLARTRSAVRHGVAYERASARLLDRFRPRAVVLVEHYTDRCLAFTRAARARGIPVAELQHGTVSPAHVAYSVAPGRRPAGFPDHLLLFGAGWMELLPGVPLEAEATPAIGFAWLEAHVEAARREPGRRVVFVSQNTIGAALSRMAAEAAPRLVDAGYQVTYKLHPGELEWRTRMPWLAAAPVEVIERGSIYDVFATATAQVGVYSTAVFEGLAFGLQTLVAELPGSEATEPLVKAGAAVRVGSADDIVRVLGPYTPGTVALPEHLRERFWRPEPRDNFRRFLHGLLDG